MKKILILLLLLLFSGCASKKELSNQTALFWHNKIYNDINYLNLDQADDSFTSLEIEHPNSKYIPIDMLILFNTHYKNSEYELAKFYIDEYEKRFANKYQKKWCEYIKIKMDFLSIHNPYTNQQKITNLIKKTNEILDKYPNSVYNYELNTIKSKLEATKIVFNNQIAKLYGKLDKQKAIQIYKIDNNQTIIPPHIPWYKKLFYW
jgi:outer membrane protein assembly factor BamD